MNISCHKDDVAYHFRLEMVACGPFRSVADVNFSRGYFRRISARRSHGLAACFRSTREAPAQPAALIDVGFRRLAGLCMGIERRRWGNASSVCCEWAAPLRGGDASARAPVWAHRKCAGRKVNF